MKLRIVRKDETKERNTKRTWDFWLDKLTTYGPMVMSILIIFLLVLNFALQTVIESRKAEALLTQCMTDGHTEYECYGIMNGVKR